MSDMIYIEEHNLFINLDHVISAKFEPEHIFEDSDTYEVGDPRRLVQVPDRITITTSALELHRLYGYEGDLESFANKSKDFTIEGAVARHVFNYFKQPIRTFPF